MLRVTSTLRRCLHSSIIRSCKKEQNAMIYDLPEEPAEGSCCGNGCPTCVWVIYGAQVLQGAKKIPKEELKKILEDKIRDPSIRQYVMMELRIQ